MDKSQMKEIRRQVRATDIEYAAGENFSRLQDFVDELNATNSKNEKIEIIKSHKDDEFITKVLHYTYNPYFKYNVTSANCRKMDHLCDMNFMNESIFDLLDDLKDRTYTGHDAIAMVNGFILSHQGHEQLIWNILDKNLKTRTDSSINKAIPGLIPEFKVALAQSYDKQAKKINFETQRWFASRKLDGVRCLAIVDDSYNVSLFSRQGNQFETLEKVERDIKALCEHNNTSNVVFDGEICLMDEDGNEDFQGIMKQIKKKDYQMDNPMFKIFDCIRLNDFYTQSGVEDLASRIELCVHLCNEYNTWGLNHVSVLEQWPVTTDAHFQQLCTIASKEGWEGLMIREDVPYEGKRTNSLLKVKKFHDEEYTVNKLIMETHRIIDSVTGLETEREMLAAVEIEHKGNIVKVGSGFSQDQRIQYFENPNDLLGKIITVQYFEETTNKDGKHSLRFPVMKYVYTNGRTV